jgi:murein DD-endopeptidase MepM/ murein hydrolase activator NlpD
MANYLSPAKITGELAIFKIDNYNELLAKEELLFPADELYNSSWDTINVNPFKSSEITFPDTYTINCISFSLPVDNEIKITSKYGIRRRRMHTGTDLKVYVGDTIRAAFEGKVRIKRSERRGYGNYLVLRHPNGLETVYGHLSKFLVKENQIVQSGQAIAIGGNTGRSSGSHLHFETRFLGRVINPEEIIDFENGVPRKDEYVFHNIKVNGKKTNIYSTSADAGATAIHSVKKGETLGHIAIKYGTTVDELCKLNGISRTSMLSIGQAIRFRSKQISVEATPEAIQQTVQEQKTATTPKTAVKSETGAIQTTPSDGPIYHSIEAGDTLYSLAKKYGTTIEKLCELNQFNENIIIKIRKKIRCS